MKRCYNTSEIRSGDAVGTDHNNVMFEHPVNIVMFEHPVNNVMSEHPDQ